MQTPYLSEVPVPDMSSQQKRTLGVFVDYVLSLNLRIDAISESDTARQRLMIRYFEQIIDGMVYELFFGDELHRAGKYFFEPLARETLPIIEESSTDQKAALDSVFRSLFDKEHVIRQNIFFLDTLENVRMIEGKHEALLDRD